MFDCGLLWCRSWSLCADHSESTGRTINVVPPLKAVVVGIGHLGRLDQFPERVLTGSWQPRVIHEWICNAPGLIAADEVVLSRAAVGEQLQRPHIFLRGQGDGLDLREGRWRQQQGKSPKVTAAISRRVNQSLHEHSDPIGVPVDDRHWVVQRLACSGSSWS